MQRSTVLRSLYRSASWETGRPPWRPYFLRLAAWSAFSGITALMRRRRRLARLALEEYALSAATASGRVRGRPTGPRTVTFFRTAVKWGLSAACPSVSSNDSGRQRRSAARWTLLVSPPRERPIRAAFSLARRLRRSRLRSCRWGAAASSPSTSAPFRAFVPHCRPFFSLLDRFFEGGEGLLTQRHAGGVVVGAGDRGVHADQGQVRLPAPGRLGDHPVQHGLEDALVTPLEEAVIDGLPGPEFRRDVPPGAAGPEPEDHRFELLPQPLRVRSESAYRQERLDQLPVIISEFCTRHGMGLPDPQPARAFTPHVDHNKEQSLEAPCSSCVHAFAARRVHRLRLWCACRQGRDGR